MVSVLFSGENWKIQTINNHCNDGIIATRDIKAGDLIIQEKPIWIESKNLEGAQRAYEHVMKANPKWLDTLYYREDKRKTYYNRMKCAQIDIDPYEQEKQYLSKFMAQVDINSFDVGGFHLLYLQTSKINHSCLPNATRNVHCKYLDCSLKKERSPRECIGKIYAIRDIKKGEQITISYLSPDELLLPTNQRNDAIKKKFGFHCQCIRCIDNSDKNQIEKLLKGATTNHLKLKKIANQAQYIQTMKKEYENIFTVLDNKDVTTVKRKCKTFLNKYDKLTFNSYVDVDLIDEAKCSENDAEMRTNYNSQRVSLSRLYNIGDKNKLLLSTHWRNIQVRMKLFDIYQKMLPTADINAKYMSKAETINTCKIIEEMCDNATSLMICQKIIFDNCGCGIKYEYYTDGLIARFVIARHIATAYRDVLANGDSCYNTDNKQVVQFLKRFDRNGQCTIYFKTLDLLYIVNEQAKSNC